LQAANNYLRLLYFLFNGTTPDAESVRSGHVQRIVFGVLGLASQKELLSLLSLDPTGDVAEKIRSTIGRRTKSPAGIENLARLEAKLGKDAIRLLDPAVLRSYSGELLTRLAELSPELDAKSGSRDEDDADAAATADIAKTNQRRPRPKRLPPPERGMTEVKPSSSKEKLEQPAPLETPAAARPLAGATPLVLTKPEPRQPELVQTQVVSPEECRSKPTGEILRQREQLLESLWNFSDVSRSMYYARDYLLLLLSRGLEGGESRLAQLLIAGGKLSRSELQRIQGNAAAASELDWTCFAELVPNSDP
jgi:hypothetical protein